MHYASHFSSTSFNRFQPGCFNPRTHARSALSAHKLFEYLAVLFTFCLLSITLSREERKADLFGGAGAEAEDGGRRAKARGEAETRSLESHDHYSDDAGLLAVCRFLFSSSVWCIIDSRVNDIHPPSTTGQRSAVKWKRYHHHHGLRIESTAMGPCAQHRTRFDLCFILYNRVCVTYCRSWNVAIPPAAGAV